jgi:hypothetical protein
VSTIVITHLNSDIVETLSKVLTVIRRPATGLTLVMSNPAKQVRHLMQELRCRCESVLWSRCSRAAHATVVFLLRAGA